MGDEISRDPAEEGAGGLNLYGFLGNHAIDDVDAFGLMRWGDLKAIAKALDDNVRTIGCCCDKPSFLRVTSITGTASGSQVTDTLHIEKIGCVDDIEVVQYYWWDCVTAQGEYAADTSPSRPEGLQAWQDYGWHVGANPETKRHKGVAERWWRSDPNDADHWNWQGAVLYVYCSLQGNMRAKLAFSEPLEWTWKNGKWTDPHEGRGPAPK